MSNDFSINYEEVFDCRKAYAATIEECAQADESVVVIVNDSIGSSNLGNYQKLFPDRLINVGIAEQNQVGVAAGLENLGFKPIVSCAGSFLSARAMEQVKIDAAYSARHIVLAAQSPGLAYGQLGSTHHSAEDIAWMRVIPNMTVIVPSDPVETALAMRWAITQADGPVYIRISRMPVPIVHSENDEFIPGRSYTLREGKDVALIANGVCTVRALKAAEILEAQGIDARVISMPCVKPLDTEVVDELAATHMPLFTIEEGMASGAMGGAISEYVTSHQFVPVTRLGVPDEFAPTGSESWLLDHYGMSPEAIAKIVAQKISQ